MDSLISRFDQALNGQKKPILIFDIDSTIFNVSPRNQDIFDLFCSIYSGKNPILHKVSSLVRLSYKDWGLDPYTNLIGNETELKKSASSFWRKHFFAGTFLSSDQPYNKALELVCFFESKGCEILYLTGRDNHRMREGTLHQLKHWKLPLKKDSDLITKPHKGMNDGDYKKSEISALLKKYLGHPIFFFDNEPSVLEYCIFSEQKNYTPIFIKSTHSSRALPQKEWHSLEALAYEDFLLKLKGL